MRRGRPAERTSLRLWRLAVQAGRRARPTSSEIIHQLWGGFEGEASDIELQARETIALKRRIEELIVQHSGQAPEKVSTDMGRGYYFMSAEEAVVYGIIEEPSQ